MLAIRTVVCPVDFSAATAPQLDLAVDLCLAFGARMVVHHNITDVSVGAAVGWMWHADHVPPVSSTTPDEAVRELIRRVPPGIPTESCVTRGAAIEAVLSVSDAAEADVVVMSAHSGKTDDHVSVIEFMLEHSARPVLALHDFGEDARVPAFAGDTGAIDQSIVVPVNVAHGHNLGHHLQVDVACELARAFRMHLYLLHVAERPAGASTGTEEPSALAERLEALVPADLDGQASVHVEGGDPASAIVRFAGEESASLIVMGEHTRVPVKRWLRHNTSRAVLHDARCPVWYVPTAGPLKVSFGRFALSDERSALWGNV